MFSTENARVAVPPEKTYLIIVKLSSNAISKTASRGRSKPANRAAPSLQEYDGRPWLKRLKLVLTAADDDVEKNKALTAVGLPGGVDTHKRRGGGGNNSPSRQKEESLPVKRDLDPHEEALPFPRRESKGFSKGPADAAVSADGKCGEMWSPFLVRTGGGNYERGAQD